MHDRERAACSHEWHPPSTLDPGPFEVHFHGIELWAWDLGSLAFSAGLTLCPWAKLTSASRSLMVICSAVNRFRSMRWPRKIGQLFKVYSTD